MEKRDLLVGVLASALVFTIVIFAALALTTWTQSITWTFVEPVTSFTVTGQTALDYGTIVGPTTKTEVYTVTNDGTVPVTVDASATPTGAVTAAWDKITMVLQPQATTTFTLTLQITGAGSCVVTFS